MAEYREEQEGEVEALRSIYPEEELKVISEDLYCLEVKVAVTDSDFETGQVSVDVRFQLPACYPDEVPEITITTGAGLETGEMRDMERRLSQLATENVGAVMVFTLVCGVQELLQEMLDRVREEREREKREREEEEKRLDEAKYRGTLVTVESFKAWRERFEEEIGEKKGRKKDETVATSGRLTGRQMFERDVTLALSDAKFLVDDDVELGHKDKVGMESGQQDEVEVDESLFEDFEDLALENDS